MPGPRGRSETQLQDTVPLSRLPQGRFDLSQILRVDALTCVAMGALLATLATPLAGLLGLPASLLTWAGVLLFPCAALMLLASRRPLSVPLVWIVVVGNVGWVLASLIVAFVLFDPNLLGIAFILAQAFVVAVLGGLEWRGLPAA